MGDQGYGLHPPTVERIAAEVKTVHSMGTEICMVIGGGNIFRGLQGSAQGMERTTADYMGMLATVMNALAMQSSLEEQGIHTRVVSAIPMDQVCEPYIRRRAVRHLEKKRVVIFAAGTAVWAMDIVGKGHLCWHLDRVRWWYLWGNLRRRL